MPDKNLVIYDQNYQTTQQLQNIFPETSYLLYYCQQIQQPIIHLWQSQPTVILGLRDKHLNNLKAGVNLLRAKNYAYMLRNSGGLAVVSDAGTINLSVFLPNASTISIEKAYFILYKLIQQMFPTLTIEHYEISDSYCPGDFDLVIQHKKIAGLAQRRQHQALVIMAYLSINGAQLQRGNLLHQFYKQANTNYDPHFPTVNPDSMANLNDFTSEQLTVAIFKKRLLQILKPKSSTIDLLSNEQLIKLPDFSELFNKELRNQKQLNQILLRS
ncbi:lipoyl protein ligase domain-containing protein [Bombilactobacillus thymidiniphilus]|uniref:Lipoate--protein ligase n=1 Tax=Bombilactobacillus thymidiniphilus TaxID=2923363 RepID=A0ABY4PFF1_9LACO|nr:lipoate--protein ligase [Bombilactobacillus thymidiniphilus]UQS84042.1 lipoate--protein ligase [Bombilactobacillus thymidiniphilus]